MRPPFHRCRERTRSTSAAGAVVPRSTSWQGEQAVGIARDPGGRRARRRLLGAAAVGLVLALAGQAGAFGSRSEVRKGGIFRISYAIGSGIDYLDPALAYTAPAWALLDTTCLRLMSYPDKPSPASFRLVSEAAVGPPKVSRDGKTYTFTVRPGFRFSDGKPVRASAFARAITRVLSPAMASPWAEQLSDVAGASDVRAGRAKAASGVSARGNILTIRFVRPPAAVDVRMAMPYMCAVPPSLPIDPEGRAEVPGRGPYYVARYRPDERITISRNRFYGGTRPHFVDGFDVDLRGASSRDAIQTVDRNRRTGSTRSGHPFSTRLSARCGRSMGSTTSGSSSSPGSRCGSWCSTPRARSSGTTPSSGAR